MTARPLLGTDGANNPFWSPDNRFVAFYADGKLKTVDVADGRVQSLCDVPNISFARGGAWSPNDVIRVSEGLWRAAVPRLIVGRNASTGHVLSESRGEWSHAWPSFLPDGRHFVYSTMTAARTGGVFVGSLDSTEVTPVLDVPSTALYASGHLVFGDERIAHGATL